MRHLGYPARQCLERWLAKDPRYAGHMAKPIIPLETKDQGDRTGAGRHARKRAAELLGAGVGAVRNWVKAYREDGMAALQPKNRNTGQTNKPAPRRSRNAKTVGDDVEALRRRVEELELENALMREVVEARRKRPRHRPAAPVEQGEDAAGSRQPRRPRFHGWDAEREMARGHHPGSRPGTGRACLSPPVDCHDGRIVAYTAGSGPDAGLADRMLVKVAETLPEGAHPLVRSDRGCHCRWPGWLALMDRYGLIWSTGAKGCSPDNAAAEGFFGRMKTESVYPGHWEERTRDEVLVPVDDYIRWYDHERIKRPPGWMSPVQYRQSQGMAA